MAGVIKLHPVLVEQLTSKDAVTKIFKVVINEDTLTIGECREIGPDCIQEKLENAAEIVENSHCCFLACHIQGRSNTVRWGLFFWSPDSASFEEKALYALGRDPILRLLGNPYFVEEIYCGSRDTFDATRVRTSISVAMRRRKARTAPEKEEIFNEFVTKEFNLRQRPFPPLPFRKAVGFDEAVKEFSKENHDCLVLTLNDEESTLTAAKNRDQHPSAISGRLYQREPRYYLVRSAGKSILFLSCPDGSTKPQRLLYASSKSAVVALLEQSSVEIWKSVDVRIPNDLSEAAFDEDLDNEYIPFAVQKLRPKMKKRGTSLAKQHPNIVF
eukprot:GHVN01051595.1.p1 GENE.GHVN01051595.1~~GHVN01051595.1.p1  ORF type:complete len:328 (-),score=28.58 GHVN01051595.1:1381-2364(-)